MGRSLGKIGLFLILQKKPWNTSIQNVARTQVFIIKLKNYFGHKKMNTNSLREIRESFLISKAELAKMANISVLTLTRIEHGKPCRLETKRKILMALGLKLSDRDKVFH